MKKTIFFSAEKKMNSPFVYKTYTALLVITFLFYFGVSLGIEMPPDRPYVVLLLIRLIRCIVFMLLFTWTTELNRRATIAVMGLSLTANSASLALFFVVVTRFFHYPISAVILFDFIWTGALDSYIIRRLDKDEDEPQRTPLLAVVCGPHNPAEDCTICLDKISTGVVAVLPCGHSFHEKCVRLWLQRKAVCPLCRS